MELNELRDEIFTLATKNGFHGEGQDDLCRKLMLVVSELVEAMEAERNGNTPYIVKFPTDVSKIPPEVFEKEYRGTIEEEIADAVIRLADIAGMINMDLDWWVKAKMAYNKSRPFRHGKRY